MKKALTGSVIVLALTAVFVVGSPWPLAAQQPQPLWLVVQFKLQIIEGKPMMQIMGPFPSIAICEVTLKAVQEAFAKQGLEVRSAGCRSDVTVVVPEGGAAPPAPSPPPAPSEGR